MPPSQSAVRVQLPLFSLESGLLPSSAAKKTQRSGTFTDNMKLPVHRWFRYSAGFSAEWAAVLLQEFGLTASDVVLDPFLGSGTLSVVASHLGIPSVGLDAHSFMARIARAKLLWPSSISAFTDKAHSVLDAARTSMVLLEPYPDIIERCFSDPVLLSLHRLRLAWLDQQNGSPASELVWLALTAILRAASFAGTAQWQYILPNATKKTITEPFDAFQAQVEMMRADMETLQQHGVQAPALIFQGDAQQCSLAPASVDAVITSPPYANNYDYADATRFEMSFWGTVQSWGDLQGTVRRHLIVSSSQHASIERLDLEALLATPAVAPIRSALTPICRALAEERHGHGGKKHYHTMVAGYFADMATVWLELRRVCRMGAQVCFVIGDSAPYGIHVPVDVWLGDLAVAAGFHTYRFEKLRDRNIKWKNRKHRVPLHEGRLWVEG